jgi:hypothetical protein
MSTTGIYLPKRIIKSVNPSYQQDMVPRELIDWGIIFNLTIFVIFFGSIFYICIHRYRNKEYYKRDKVRKQQQLVEDFQKALEDYQLNQHKIVYMQQQQTRLNNQIKMSQGLDSLKYKMGLMENTQKPFGNYAMNPQYMSESFKVYPQQPPQYSAGYQPPFFNSGSLLNYR